MEPGICLDPRHPDSGARFKLSPARRSIGGFKDGAYRGSINGRCLEADLLRRAAWLIRDGSSVKRYSTLFDETAEMPFGPGGGGVVDVLLESVESSEHRALLQAVDSTLSGCEQLYDQHRSATGDCADNQEWLFALDHRRW